VKSGYADIRSLEVRNFSFRKCLQRYDTETHKQFEGGGGGEIQKLQHPQNYTVFSQTSQQIRIEMRS
jgi:hypothetical protein